MHADEGEGGAAEVGEDHQEEDTAGAEAEAERGELGGWFFRTGGAGGLREEGVGLRESEERTESVLVVEIV